MFWVWLGSKTQGIAQNPTQNPESKIFDPKPSSKPGVLGLGQKPSPMPIPALASRTNMSRVHPFSFSICHLKIS